MQRAIAENFWISATLPKVYACFKHSVFKTSYNMRNVHFNFITQDFSRLEIWVIQSGSLTDILSPLLRADIVNVQSTWGSPLLRRQKDSPGGRSLTGFASEKSFYCAQHFSVENVLWAWLKLQKLVRPGLTSSFSRQAKSNPKRLSEVHKVTWYWVAKLGFESCSSDFQSHFLVLPTVLAKGWKGHYHHNRKKMNSTADLLT